MTVPETDPQLAFVLSAMVGHLFGYEAALSIDAQARPLRAARAAIEAALSAGADDHDLLDRLRPDLQRVTAPFLQGPARGQLQRQPGGRDRGRAGVAVALRHRCHPARGLRARVRQDRGARAPWSADLLDSLNAGIDELTRPVDAIKHQAKTVTVGISRSEDALFGDAPGQGHAGRRCRP